MNNSAALNPPRKGVLSTLVDATQWLLATPVLVAVFLVSGTVNNLPQLGLGPGLVLLTTILGLFAVIVADGVAHLFAEGQATDTRMSLSTALERVVSKLLSLVGISILYGLAVFLGLLAFVLPGIYLSLRLSLAFPACVIDDRRAGESLGTSWDVAHGNLLKLFGIGLVGVLVSSVAFLPLLFEEQPLELLVDGTLPLEVVALSVLLGAVVGPVLQLAYARVYLENRPRHVPERSRRSDDTHGEPVVEEGWEPDHGTT